MTVRTRLLGCVAICVLAVTGCEPGSDNPGADASNFADAGTDTGSPDAMGPDAADAFSFDGIESLEPGVVAAEDPADVALELLITGELPADAEIAVEVEGESVSLADDMTFVPPSRPGMPGISRVAVTIGDVTHVTSLRYRVDPTALQLDDDHAALDLPGTERATAVWTADTDKDGNLEYLVQDSVGGPDDSMVTLRVYEETSDGSVEARGEVELPRGAELLDKPTPVDVDKDRTADALSVTVLAPADTQDAGDRLLATRLFEGKLLPLEEVHVFSPAETVIDAMIREGYDPDQRTFLPDMTAVVVENGGGIETNDHMIRKRPGRAATYDSLGLTEYDSASLLDGSEPLGLCPDEAILGSYPTGSLVGMNVDPDTGTGEVLYAPATDYNSSRSNTTSTIAFPDFGDDCDDSDTTAKPGMEARIADMNGDGVGDLLVAAGCPGDVDVHVARGRDVDTATGLERRYGGAMKLLEAQSTTSVVHTLERRADGMLTGVATGRCVAGRCEAPVVFELPADTLGRATSDAVDVTAIPRGNPLHEEGTTGGESALYRGLAGAGGFGGESKGAHGILSPPILDESGASWVPAGGRLLQTLAPADLDSPGAITSLADLSGATDVEVAETSDGTTAVASFRGHIELRNADQAKVDGGALLRSSTPRVVMVRCATSAEEQAAGTRSWSGERCGSGFEIEELTPPEECVWNSQVSLHRAADGTYVDARVGIARERWKKKQAYRYRTGEALSQGEELGTVEFPEVEGDVVAVGDRVFSVDADGEILTGELMGGGELLDQVRLESTGITAAIRAGLGDDHRHRRILPVRIQGALVDTGLVLTAESPGSGPFVIMWNPGATDDGIGWWGHCDGWTSSLTDETPNASVEAVVSSYDTETFSIVDQLVVVRPGETAAEDELLRVQPTQQGRLLDACGEPLLGGSWPDEHLCPESGERCHGGILATGDLDGDGYGDAVLGTESGPVLYSNISASEGQRIGPVRWMAPEHLHRWSRGGGEIILGEDRCAPVAPPTLTFLDGVLSPYLR